MGLSSGPSPGSAGMRPGGRRVTRRPRRTWQPIADCMQPPPPVLESGASASLVTSIYDGTALIAAAHLGHDGAVRELIRAGAPLDHINNLGWTALIEAVILGDDGPRHTKTVRALVEAGANADLADRDGVTPVQHARARGYHEIVGLLENDKRR